MTIVRILADDLTGSLDSASQFTGADHRVAVHWDKAPGRRSGLSYAFDTETRELDEAGALAGVRAASDLFADAELCFKKTDSLLRGHAAAEIAACVTGGGFRSAVIAPAFAAQNRITRAGRQWFRLSEADDWQAVGTDLAGDLAARGTAPSLVARPELLRGAGIFLCDAENPADLEALCARAGELEPPILWCGTAGLAMALQGAAGVTGQQRPAAPLFLMIGSDAASTRRQVARLAADLPDCLHVMPDVSPRRCARVAAQIARRLGEGHAAGLAFAFPGDVDRRLAGQWISRALSAMAPRLPRPGSAFVCGGGTLHGLCRQLRVRALSVSATCGRGYRSRASRAARGTGSRWSPSRAASARRHWSPTSSVGSGSAPMTKPRRRIALTMGDPSGVGPEIALKALHALRGRTAGREPDLLIVGTPSCLRQAAADLGMELSFVESGRATAWPEVGLITAAECDRAIAPGVLSAEAGRLAFRAIDRAVKMALAGEIDAIVTAPINKEAMSAAGLDYIGHTDMLADLTGSKQSCMMLAYDHLCVTHVSTHVPLAEVPGRVTVERVRLVIDLTLRALRDLAVERPRVPVCGLNPRSGESGLLGTEEKTVLEPVIAEFRARGEAVEGPLPGDTVFVKAFAGQFDAVVAMFHDQGHIPVKLLGFSVDPVSGRWTSLRGVNVTLGLPIIRTSVDHGTAFDIAGKGIANAESMIDAIEFAVRLADAGAPAKPGPGEPVQGRVLC